MRVKILRSCVGEAGANLEAGATVELSENVARLLIGNLQAEEAGKPEPAPKPAPDPEPAPKKVAKKKVAKAPAPSDDTGEGN